MTAREQAEAMVAELVEALDEVEAVLAKHPQDIDRWYDDIKSIEQQWHGLAHAFWLMDMVECEEVAERVCARARAMLKGGA